MTGVWGGNVFAEELEPMRSEMISEPWCEFESVSTNEHAVGVLHHDEDDSTVVTSGNVTGVAFGTVVNRPALDLGGEALFTALVDRLEGTLASLDGSFLLLQVVDGTLHVATDCLSSVSCLYRETDDGIVFGNKLGTVVVGMDDPTLNVDAAAEFIARDFVFGDATLVEDINRLQPSTLLRANDDGVRTDRYQVPSYTAETDPISVESVLGTYWKAVAAAAETTEGDPGIFLTGGLTVGSCPEASSPNSARSKPSHSTTIR